MYDPYPEEKLRELSKELARKLKNLSSEFITASKDLEETEMRAMIFSQLAVEWGARNGVLCAWLLTKDPSFRNTKNLQAMLEPKAQRLKEKLLKIMQDYCAELAGETDEDLHN